MPTTRSIGNAGESAVCDYLAKQGYRIIYRNWRTRWCEIDIIALKNNILYFVEVKSRKNDHFGSGLDYITPKKQSQMQFAAEYWVASNNYSGSFMLAAASYNSSSNTIELIELY